MSEMAVTYLIQRLGPKHKTQFMKKAEQVFGGGMMRINPEGWEVLQSLFSVEYMGSAEFEFGALPKSLLEFSHDKKDLIEFELQLAHNPAVPVYVVCRHQHREGVVERLEKLAKRQLRLKEMTNFEAVMDPHKEERQHQPTTCGWYELDNGFFFFTDKVMATRTFNLFKNDEYEPDNA